LNSGAACRMIRSRVRSPFFISILALGASKIKATV
jgi:hypothetical protein